MSCQVTTDLAAIAYLDNEFNKKINKVIKTTGFPK